MECLSHFKLHCLLLLLHTYSCTGSGVEHTVGGQKASQLYRSIGSDEVWQISPFGSPCRAIHTVNKCHRIAVCCVCLKIQCMFVLLFQGFSVICAVVCDICV